MRVGNQGTAFLPDGGPLPEGPYPVYANLEVDDYGAASGELHFASEPKYPPPISIGLDFDLHIPHPDSIVGDSVVLRVRRVDDSGSIKGYVVGSAAQFRPQAKASPSSGDNNEEDDLLPVLRRKVFDKDLAALSSTASEAEPVSLLMLDLDHFKAVNDTHGHPIGDEVLVDCANAIVRRCRHKGNAYRFGGEEIAVLLPNFTTSEAVSLAESIRSEIETSKMSSKRLSITASIGVATAPSHAIEGKELLNGADEALYAAKHDGRNLVRVVEKGPKAPTVEPQPNSTNGARHVNVVQPVNAPIAKISKDDVPSGDKAVYTFLEMIALGFALEAVASFMRGDVWWRWISALVFGVLFFVAGVKWSQIKLTIAPRLVSILEHIANNRLYRRTIYTAIVLAILLSIELGIYRRYFSGSASDKDTSFTDTSGPAQPLTPLESLTVSPIKLVFKDQAVGKTSSPQTATLVNRGTAARIITGINTTGNFSQTNDCGSELMVGDSCNVEVKFTPTTLGLTHGSLEISCRDPLFSSTNLFVTVDLSGSGQASLTQPLQPHAERKAKRGHLQVIQKAGDPPPASSARVGFPNAITMDLFFLF